MAKTEPTKSASKPARKTSFMRNQNGSINIMMAAMMPVIAAGVGVVVDGANLIRMQNHLQESADTAALAAASHVSKTPEYRVSDVNEVANRFLDANFRGGEGAGNGPKASLESVVITDDDITVQASYNQKHFIMGMFGQSNSIVRVTARADYEGPEDIEARIALVLDNSYSMYGSRISDLKNATKKFATYFKDSPHTDIGIVPFATYVNVGTDKRGKNWLEVMPDNDKVTSREQCSTNRPVTGTSNCRTVTGTQATYPNGTQKSRRKCETRDGANICWNETYWDNGTPVYVENTYQQCDNTYGNPVTTCNTVEDRQTFTWNGCVSSRTDPHSETSYFDGEKFIGLTNTQCPPAITPMTSNTSQLMAAANAMRPDGETFIPQGIEWGRIMLDPREPLPYSTSGKGNDHTNRFMIVMSDGNNTQDVKEYSRNSANVTSLHNPDERVSAQKVALHKTGNPKKADKLMVSRCEAAKADDVLIFTIAMGVPSGSDSLKALKGCATDPKWHFSFNNSSQLDTVFENIADEITRYLAAVRLTQ